MNPQTVRRVLQVTATVLAVLTAVVATLQEVDFSKPLLAISSIALAVGLAIGKASEAPGGIARWKIPENLQKFIPK